MSGPQIVVTTVVRHAPAGRPSGYIHVLDSHGGRTLRKVPIHETGFRRFDPNPRGGLRGARGVTVRGDRIAVANTDSVAIYDRDWKLVARMTHPLMGGVHDILADDEGLWITCTHADLLLKVNWRGDVLDVWDWRREPSLVEQLGLPPLPRVDLPLDYRDPRVLRGRSCNLAHVNAVAASRDGLLISFGRVASRACRRKLRLDGAAARLAAKVGADGWGDRSICRALSRLRILKPTYHGCHSYIVERPNHGPPRILRRTRNATEPNHNVLRIGNRIVFCNTNDQCLVAFRPDEPRDECRIFVPGSPGFVRGLAAIGGDRVLVGSQAPAAVYEVDLTARTVLQRVRLQGAGEAVYAIGVLFPEPAAPGPCADEGDRIHELYGTLRTR